MGFAPAGYLTINQAADKLGISPWEVLALVDAQAVESVTLVDAASLSRYQQESA